MNPDRTAPKGETRSQCSISKCSLEFDNGPYCHMPSGIIYAIRNYCPLFMKNDNIYDVLFLNRVILIRILSNSFTMFRTKMSFLSSKMAYVSYSFRSYCPLFMKLSSFFDVRSLIQVISNGTLQTLDTVLHTKMSCPSSNMIHIILWLK